MEPPIRAELRVQTLCLSILATVAVTLALYWLRPVMIPFIVAAFLAFAIIPLVDVLEVRVRLPRVAAVCMALLLVMLILIALGVLVSVSVVQIQGNAEVYKGQFTKLNRLVTDFLQRDLGFSGVQEHDLTEFLTGTVQTLLLGTTNAVLGIVSQGAIVVVFLFFLLMSSVKRDRPIGGAWGEMESRIRAYLVTMTTISIVTGVLIGAVLAALGVKSAILFGLLAFLLNFIPNIGSVLATILPIPIILVSDLSIAQMILAVVIPAAIQIIIGNFIQPKLMEGSMRLHPVVILMALIFWGMIWGIVGMFFAVPLTSIIGIGLYKHPFTRPIAELMAGNLNSLRDEPIEIPQPTATQPAQP